MVDQVIKLKRNTANTNAPDTNDIVVGELAIGAVAGKLYLRKSDDSILTFSDDTNVSTTLTIAADSGSNDNVTVGTNTLTFNGTSNQIGTTVSDNAITIALADNPVVGGTGSIRVPDGTTGQRPGSPAAGMFRYNTTTSKFEGYTDAWGDIGGGGSNTFSRNAYTGDGSTVAFTLSQTVNSENDLIVFIEGVFQDQDAYSVSGTTLTFDTAPVNGRGIIVYSVKHTVAGSNLNIDTMTGDGSDTTLALTISPNDENNTQVFIDGVYQNKSTYSISGSTLTFSAAPPNGSAVECMTFTQTDVNEATFVTANANNSTNETVFPTFVDGATGKQEIETDTGFTYNPSTGVLTSTSFAGQVTTAAQTNITSLFATDIKIGEDDQTKIDFETADEIHFYAANAHQIKLVDGALVPATNNDIDLGTSSVEFKNAFFDGAVTADSFVGPLTGNADTASIATAATNVTASANNSTDETVYLTFVDGTTGSQGIETDSGLTYNPSSGLLTITGELDAGSLDISGDVDVDGTLETDNLTVGGAQGSDGQVLTSTGSGVGWETPSSFNADAAQVFNESGADANFRIESDGLEYMFFVDAGNNRVAINHDAPSGIFHVAGHTSSVASIFESNGNGDTVPVQLKVKANNGTTSTQGLYGNAGSASTDNTITLGPSGTSGVVVNNDGNVGIGTTAPDARLHVKDVGGTSTALILQHATNDVGKGGFVKFQASNVSGSVVDYGQVKCEIVNRAAGAQAGSLHLYTAAGGSLVERLELDATNNMNLYSSSGDTTIKFYEGSTIKWWVQNDTAGSPGSDSFWIGDEENDNGVYVGQDGSSWTGISDERLKRNWTNLENATDKIKTLTKVGTFQRRGKTTGNWSDNREVGLSAQEVEAILPEVVTTGGDIEFASDDKVTGVKGMAYEKLVPLLVKSIQELEARIKTLEG